MSFTPEAALEAEAEYCFYVYEVVDLAGEPLLQNGQQLSFFTTGTGPQTAGPQVVSVSPRNQNEPLSTVSVGSGAVAVSANGQAVAGTVSVSGPAVVTDSVEDSRHCFRNNHSFRHTGNG